MHITDPIADMLTRIRNANSARHDTVDVPASNMKKSIAQILLDEGYIKSFQLIDDGTQGVIRIALKYNAGKEKVLTGLRRVSKPGLRVYAGADELPRVLRGLGIAMNLERRETPHRVIHGDLSPTCRRGEIRFSEPRRGQGYTVMGLCAPLLIRIGPLRPRSGEDDGSRLPRGLAHPGDLPAVGHLTEADTAHAVVTQVGVGAAADLAAVVLPGGVLGRGLLLKNHRLLCHFLILPYRSKGAPTSSKRALASSSVFAVVHTTMSIPRILSILSYSISGKISCSLMPKA